MLQFGKEVRFFYEFCDIIPKKGVKVATEINTEEIFKQLKKQNGEKFAQAIRGDRDHDGNLLVIPNILHILEFAGHDEDEARKLRPILKEIYLTK